MPSSIASRQAAPATVDCVTRWKRALAKGHGRCYVFVENGDSGSSVVSPSPADLAPQAGEASPEAGAVSSPWRRIGFSTHLACEDCDVEYPIPEPRLYSFNNPMGACPECEGFGNVVGIDMDLVVPNPGKTLRDNAIAPWNTPAYAHELKELIALAPDYDIPLDVPFRELSEQQRNLIMRGCARAEIRGVGRFLCMA